jgi:hypothetical protein
MTTNAARRAVFDIPELLENIIIFLPEPEIRTKVQRVSRAWKAVVKSSHTIQAKLWLRPQNGSAMQPTEFSNDHTFATPNLWYQELACPMYLSRVSLNPFFEKPKSRHSFSSLMPPRSTGRFECLEVINLHKGLESICTDKRPSTNLSYEWRDMYLTNPPITTGLLRVQYVHTSEGRGSAVIVESMIRDRDGITLGFLHDMF